MEMKYCMDGCTTSPVESNNNTIKHGAFKINSNMNLDKTAQRLLDGINTRLQRQKNKALREVNSVNRASRAHTIRSTSFTRDRD